MWANTKNLDQIITMAQEVGRFQMSFFRTFPLGHGSEKEAKEFVSRIDIDSEKMIKKELMTIFPGAGFLGEESGAEPSTDEENPYCWVVDPLDGTTNYLSGLDQFSISIALLKGQNSELGIVYKPSTGELYSAIKGQGACLNQKPLKKAQNLEPEKALIGTGFPFRSRDTTNQFHNCVSSVLDNFRGIRRFGSAALDISYVSAGFLQGFWEVDLQAYDVAAGLLFLEETNCRAFNFQGEKYNPFKHRSLVTGHPKTVEKLLALTKTHYPNIK